MCNLNIEFPHFYPRQRLSRPDKKFTADIYMAYPLERMLSSLRRAEIPEFMKGWLAVAGEKAVF